jgi:hypothetical protein
MKVYFLERCSGGSKSWVFGKQSNHFSQKRVTVENKKIVLFENDKIVTNPNEVSNHFNIVFSTVADKIGIHAYMTPQTIQVLKKY